MIVKIFKLIKKIHKLYMISNQENKMIYNMFDLY